MGHKFTQVRASELNCCSLVKNKYSNAWKLDMSNKFQLNVVASVERDVDCWNKQGL